MGVLLHARTSPHSCLPEHAPPGRLVVVPACDPTAGYSSTGFIDDGVGLYDSKVLDAGALLTMPRLKRAYIGGVTLPPQQVQQLRRRLGDGLHGAP